MPSPADDPSIATGMVHMFDFLASLGPAGIVAAVMWMWMKREATRADALQEKFNKAIDRALEDEKPP